MIIKFISWFIIFGLALFFIFSITTYAQETEVNDPVLKERIELIQASQKMSEEQKESSLSKSGISLFLTDFHTDETEYKLGGKFEQLLPADFVGKRDDISLAYVIEGIYLEGESTSLAGFLSLKATFNNRLFSPYFGLGVEFMGVADYQGFVGLNLMDNNFFIETKFINDQDEWDSGSFYSVVGFKINL